LPLQLYKKEKILEACLSVFARHGYKNTSTRMLAEAAGISKALIFRHFQSKKKLYFTLLDHFFERIRSELDVDFLVEYKDFFEAVDKYSRIQIDFYRKHPHLYKLVYEVFYSPPDEIKEEIEKMYAPIMAAQNQVWYQLFENVPLKEGIDRKRAFELIMIVSRNVEKKFLIDVTDVEAMHDEYVNNIMEEINDFYNMICQGIKQKENYKN
jgi:AcrR family transcriptional regulator